MEKNLKCNIENMRALASSALGTLQALDDQLKAFVSILSADRDGNPSAPRSQSQGEVKWQT
jgi:hypothetical protein